MKTQGFIVTLFLIGIVCVTGSKRGMKIEEKCSRLSIQISQSPTTELPNGIPQYRVEIENTCTDCAISQIHINCGMFSSARLINPKIFKRLRYNDCLVNDGKTLRSGAVVSFTYATTFAYPLSVSSVLCA
ncbi:unnamed protein product [Sphenostylis stenocarpa]|uniref:Uncharacterized protein n=1 Tax=Sphenostylis stenocarpa TaxID=92480 RepID=A0AA86S304_9FABA|nr:unnamed protein product [Sphenostylis stenocarpa]